MAPIQSIGIGGLGDTLTDLLDKLGKAEKMRLQPYTSQQQSYKAKLSAYGTLKSSLAEFNNLNKQLANPDFFNNTLASEHPQFKVTTSTNTPAGSYRIEVLELASAKTLATANSVNSKTENLGDSAANDRSITITAGNPPKEVNIPLSDDQTSLEGMSEAINAADAGVTATVIRVSDNEYTLAISSSTTGADSDIAIQVNNDDKLGDILNYDPAATTNSMKVTAPGTDAALIVNGISITRSSNSISDALPGVTLELKSKTKENEPENLVISGDKNGSVDKIKEWVDSYNALLDTFNSLSKYTPAKPGESSDTKNGALLGDSTLRGIQSSIKNALSSAQDNPELKGLGNLGITTNSTTGKLELDSDKLKQAIDEKPDQVANFFVGNGKDSGMATSLHNEIQDYIKSGGVIENSTKSIDTTLARLDIQINRVEESIENAIERYRRQFVQLDVLMIRMQGTSDYLTQQFAPK